MNDIMKVGIVGTIGGTIAGYIGIGIIDPEILLMLPVLGALIAMWAPWRLKNMKYDKKGNPKWVWQNLNEGEQK